MCKLCVQGSPQNHFASRRSFLKSAAATGAIAAAGFGLFAARPALAHDDPPEGTGQPNRRYVIRNGYVMSMDPQVGNFVRGDVLVHGKKILAVGPNLHAGNAAEIDARGRVVMPGFIDTHHHQAWTAIRSAIPDAILIDDGTGTPSAQQNYFANVLAGPLGTSGFARHYRPEDVYISELFGGLAQLDNGVTTVHDISQIHHSPEHSDAAVKALIDTGRRAALGYFESAGGVAGNQYPNDAFRIKQRWFSSTDQLTTMIMGGEVYLGAPTYTQAWTIGRQLGLQIAAHILSPFGIRPILDDLAAGTGGVNNNIGLGPDNLFVHMTGMSDFGWQKVKEKGVQVSIAFPIEMNMRHGIPPILKMQQLGIEPSLSSDVETNMTADFFTQMRSAMTMQRMVVNQAVLEQGDFTTHSVADAGTRHAPAPQCARRAAFRHHQRCQAPAARQQDRLAQARQGGRHHPARRHPPQRGAHQPRAGSGRHADGAQQRRDGDRRRQDPQMEGAAARRRSVPAAQPARGLARLHLPRRQHPAESVPLIQTAIWLPPLRPPPTPPLTGRGDPDERVSDWRFSDCGH